MASRYALTVIVGELGRSGFTRADVVHSSLATLLSSARQMVRAQGRTVDLTPAMLALGAYDGGFLAIETRNRTAVVLRELQDA